MWPDPEAQRFRPSRRRALELGITPLIDIVFLLLIFFMLTSRFVVQEGIQVDLPTTERPHALPGVEAHRLTVRSDGVITFLGQSLTLRDLDALLLERGPGFMSSPFEILSDRRASVQSVVSVLELLRERGASRVTLGTETFHPKASP